MPNSSFTKTSTLRDFSRSNSNFQVKLKFSTLITILNSNLKIGLEFQSKI